MIYAILIVDHRIQIIDHHQAADYIAVAVIT
jgi:hypothetical protein